MSWPSCFPSAEPPCTARFSAETSIWPRGPKSIAGEPSTDTRRFGQCHHYARRGAAEWERIGVPEQLRLRTDFLRVRAVVDQRLATAATGHGVRLVDGRLVTYDTLLARYRSVLQPIDSMLDRAPVTSRGHVSPPLTYTVVE